MTAQPVPQERLDLGNVAWLTLALVLVALPHLPRMPLWLGAVCVTVIGLRIYLTLRGMRLPNRWLVGGLAVAAGIGVLVTFRTLFGRDPGVALLLVLLTLKLLELRARRDAFIAIFLGFFLLIAHFLYSQSVLMGAYSLLVLWVFVAALVGFNHRVAKASWRERLHRAGMILLQAGPMMLLLFLLFPRIDGPLWGLPKDAYAGLSGLSDSMTLGNIAQLSLSDEVAFRVAFSGSTPPPAQLYWRGPVLSDSDGETWRAGHARSERAVTLAVRGAQVSYSVTLEAHGKPWLFALDMPTVLPVQSRLSAEYQLLAHSAVTARRRYAVTSALDYRAHSDAAAEDLVQYLRLPAGSNPASRALADSWRARADTGANIVAMAAQHFRAQPYSYTLRPPLLGGAHVIDEFMFKTRSGFCEHYAGSFVFLMRAAGVPARVVTGYQGGEVNPVGGFMTVRQADAHAWAEVWLQGRGWVRVDPTSYVAPHRVELGIDATRRAAGVPALAEALGWLKRARFTWDAFNNGWNQWVLGYNQERQRRLFTGFGMPHADARQLATALAIGAVAIVLVLALAVLRHHRAVRPDPVLQAYTSFCRRLARGGLQRLPMEGPLDFAQRVASSRPALAAQVDEITRLYVALRYGVVAEADAAGRLKDLVRDFRLA